MFGLTADYVSIRDLATKRTGLQWYAIYNCKGIKHFCTTILKIGGTISDIAPPPLHDQQGVPFAWLYMVQGRATHDSNAAGSNVLKLEEGTTWQQQPISSCAVDHARAESAFPSLFDAEVSQSANFAYSHRRQGDSDALKQLELASCGKFDAEKVYRQTQCLPHHPSSNIGPATWTLSKARDIKKALKKEVYGVGQSPEAAVLQLQVVHQRALEKWLADHGVVRREVQLPHSTASK